MTPLREWIWRLLNTVRPSRGDAELEDELRAHIELAIEDERQRCDSPADVDRAVRLRLGRPAQALDALRDQRDLPGVRDAIRDFVEAARSLRRAPGFALMAVATLGVGLGATTTVFSAVEALLFRPLAVGQPHELFAARRPGESRTRFSLEFYRALHESGTVFTAPIGSFTFPVTLIAEDVGSRAEAAFVTPNYFDELGIRPVLGQMFTTGDEPDVVVISHRYWRERFGSRPSTVGESIRIGAGAFVVGGVAPPGFGGLQIDIAVDVWVQAAATREAIPIPSFRPSFDILGRLAAGASPEAATSQLNVGYERWRDSLARIPSPGPVPPLALVSASHGLDSTLRDQFRESLGLLVGICVCLWAITIVNVAGLVAARRDERCREVGIRKALGATTRRLFVQALVEASVLVTGGLLVGFVVTNILSYLLPRTIPAWAGIDIHVSGLVVCVTSLTSGCAVFAIALAQSRSIDRCSVIEQSASRLVHVGDGRRVRMSTLFVAVQMAATLPTIVMAALLAQSLYHLGRVDTGFERRGLLQVSVEPALVGYSGSRARAYYGALVERLRAFPGITDASTSTGGALSGYGGIARLGHDGDWREVMTNSVDDRYFSTMGIRLLSGRAFDAVEARGRASVVVVNDALARRLFGSVEHAIGQVVMFDRGRAREHGTIIGVVENTTDMSLRDALTPTAYLPVGESPLLVVHARLDIGATDATTAIQQAAKSLDPRLPILGIESIEGRRHDALQRERLLAGASAAIALSALALSALGLFGRVRRDVTSRMQEIVIRSVLGATRLQIAKLFLRDTARLLLVSGIVGTGAAFVAARVIKSQIFGVSDADLTTYIAGATTLALAAAVATLLPLRRATRAEDSMRILRA